jgi:hypothetical protein
MMGDRVSHKYENGDKQFGADYRLEWKGQSKIIVSRLHKDGNSFVHPE